MPRLGSHVLGSAWPQALFIGAGARPAARIVADASPRIHMSSARCGRRRFSSALGPDPPRESVADTSPRIPVSSARHGCRRLPQFTDANVAKRERALVIALHRDVSALRAAIVGPFVELARLDLGFPVGTSELVLEQLDAVQPVLDVSAVGDDARRVPLADGFQMTGGRRVQRVRGAGARQSRFVVGALRVVEQLILGRAPVDVIVFLGATIEDAAVARLADLPVDRQLEIAELVLRHDVGDAVVLGERAVFDDPPLGHGIILIAAPRVERLAIEQHFPRRFGLRVWGGNGQRDGAQKQAASNHGHANGPSQLNQYYPQRAFYGDFRAATADRPGRELEETLHYTSHNATASRRDVSGSR